MTSPLSAWCCVERQLILEDVVAVFIGALAHHHVQSGMIFLRFTLQDDHLPTAISDQYRLATARSAHVLHRNPWHLAFLPSEVDYRTTASFVPSFFLSLMIRMPPSAEVPSITVAIRSNARACRSSASSGGWWMLASSNSRC